MIDVAYLRVYRPAEQVRLPVSVGSGDLPRLGVATLTTESQIADAWEVEWNGTAWRCPRVPRRRMLESLVAFHEATNRFGVGLIDGTVAEAARRELARIRRGVAEPPSVMVSAWHPPLRWFIGFVPEDSIEPMLLRSSLGKARDRVTEAVAAMRRAELPEMWIEDMGNLAQWLDAFGAVGMLELDYREVGWRLGSTLIDDTAFDVASAVDALLEGDVEQATRMYGSAMFRWAEAQAVAYSS